MAALIGFSTCSFPPEASVAQMLAFALEHGFRALELEVNETNFHPDRVDRQLLERLRSLAQSGALMLGVHSPGDVNLSVDSEVERMNGAARIASSVRLAADLGARTVVVHPGRVPQPFSRGSLGRAWNQNVIAIRRLAVLANSLGTSISVENLCHEKGSVAPDITAFRRLYDDIGPGLIGVTLDTNHAALVDGLETSLSQVGDLVNYIHFSSNKGVRSDHCEPVVGVVDFRPMRSFLATFSGPVMIELNPTGEDSAGAILRTRDFLDALIGRASDAAGTVPSGRMT